MAAKLVQVSADAGVTWYTLPGGSGDLSEDAESIADTVFGQTFMSNEIGLISWKVAADALYKGFPGFKAKIKGMGTTTVFTDEAFTLVSGKTYQITATTKRIWDRSFALVVKDNAVTVSAANILSYDFLFGKVTFVASYTVTGPVTVSGKYFPTTPICSIGSINLKQTVNTIDHTDLCNAQANGGYRVFIPGLRTVSAELSGFYDLTNAFRAALLARSEVIIEFNPDGIGDSLARGFFKLAAHKQSGDVGALEEESVTYQLNVPSPDSKAAVPFSWQHSNTTTLSQAIRILLDSFINQTVIDVQYLPDGVAGVKGNAVVTDVSLEAALNGMNKFTADFQGSGVQTVV